MAETRDAQPGPRGAARPRPSLPAPPSMKEVAALAGVSVGTVSNTINRPGMVRRHTREAVESAIEQLGFVPNQHARVLTGISSQVIGLVVLDVVNPFFMEVARAVERAASEAGHMVILCNSENLSENEDRLMRMLAAQRVRGVLLTPAGSSPSKQRERISNDRLPVVYLDYERSSEDCSVSVDDIHGARLAVEHLIKTGHERIAFVGGPKSLRQMAQRVQGARAAIIGAGLDPESSLITIHTPGIGIQDGIYAGTKLLEGSLPTGIICGNDMMAFGVYRSLNQTGLRAPNDFSLIGYDDVDFAADWVVPLTSVRQPIDELGYRAAKLLLEHSANDPGHIHQQVVLQPELIIRHSTRTVGSED